jgi:HEAT repeat protein
VPKIDEYRVVLESLDRWEPYLLEHSGLPGPRGNIELGQAAADAGALERFDALLRWTPDRAPVGSREEFLAFCGTVGLGKLAAGGSREVLPRLRELASDPRWRVREAVAMALQRVGAVDMPALLREMRSWAKGNDLERRAAAAALCEPALLGKEKDAVAVLSILDRITADLARSRDRSSDGFRALRKGLAYCWSVAVAAAPDRGRTLMERWIGSEDPDVRWVMKQNLAKKRIAAAGAEWVAAMTAELR